MDGFVLTDDALMQTRFHVQEFFGITLHHLGEGDACPLMDNAGDVIHIHHFIELVFQFPFIALFAVILLFEAQASDFFWRQAS